jgi:glycosyltransferase involved in cell wall biosynthesis
MAVAPAGREPAHRAARPNCAIHFVAEAYDADRPLVVGRQSAGAGFLDALLRYGEVDQLFCLTDAAADFETFRARVGRHGQAPPPRWVRPFDGDALEEAGCVFMPGPVISEGAWMRRYVGERRYSLCGVTHSVATERVIRSIRDFMVAPTQPWDALICTSVSARQAIDHIFESWSDYLRSRGFSAGRTPVRFPVIPLGVHLDRFARSDPAVTSGAAMREQMRLAQKDVLLLSFGRLDFRSKAHPVPLFRAVEIASRHVRGDGRLHLAMVGQFSDSFASHEFAGAQRLFCPSVPVHWINGADAEAAGRSWHAADIFISLADNVQESFGLTPVEAMAASLPCIVSDWNGYRETVVHGETGFTVPTLMAPAGAGIELADEHARATFDHFALVAFTAQSTAVDIDACAGAIAQLAKDAALRRRMGDAGRRRAEQVYDWRRIIRRYQALWAELADLRRSAPAIGARDSSRQTVHPDYPDLVAMFAGHPSRTLEPVMTARLCDPEPHFALRQLRSIRMNTVARPVMLDDPQIDRIVARLGRGDASVLSLLADVQARDRDRAIRSLMWLAKFGIIALLPRHGAPSDA